MSVFPLNHCRARTEHSEHSLFMCCSRGRNVIFPLSHATTNEKEKRSEFSCRYSLEPPFSIGRLSVLVMSNARQGVTFWGKYVEFWWNLEEIWAWNAQKIQYLKYFNRKRFCWMFKQFLPSEWLTFTLQHKYSCRQLVNVVRAIWIENFLVSLLLIFKQWSYLNAVQLPPIVWNNFSELK